MSIHTYFYYTSDEILKYPKFAEILNDTIFNQVGNKCNLFYCKRRVIIFLPCFFYWLYFDHNFIFLKHTHTEITNAETVIIWLLEYAQIDEEKKMKPNVNSAFLHIFECFNKTDFNILITLPSNVVK